MKTKPAIEKKKQQQQHRKLKFVLYRRFFYILRQRLNNGLSSPYLKRRHITREHGRAAVLLLQLLLIHRQGREELVLGHAHAVVELVKKANFRWVLELFYIRYLPLSLLHHHCHLSLPLSQIVHHLYQSLPLSLIYHHYHLCSRHLLFFQLEALPSQCYVVVVV